MDVPCDLLLHPELLTNEQLIQVIHQRCLRIPNLDSMTRDDILDVFHQFCVPYGQRKYRDTGRGKVLNKMRHTVPETPTKLNIMSDSQSRKAQYNSDRIKPPPDLLSGHMKRIKLDRPTPIRMEVHCSSKRKMSIDSTSPPAESPTPAKKERKPITWP